MSAVGLTKSRGLVLHNVLLIEELENGIVLTIGDGEEIELEKADEKAVMFRVEMMVKGGHFVRCNSFLFNFRRAVLFQDFGSTAVITYDAGQQVDFDGDDAAQLAVVWEKLIKDSDGVFNRLASSSRN